MPATMIDRASAADLMQQASGHGSAPMQVAGVLVLHGRPSPDEVRAAIADRIRAVPRLRRRLVRAPFGAGRPVWVDDPAFVARADLAAVRSVAHVHGGTVNDVVLAAVTGALREVLAGRGEVVDRFVISVPVSPRRRTDAARLGNEVGVLPIELPATGDPWSRLDRVARIVRSRKTAAPGTSSALLAPMIRALA